MNILLQYHWSNIINIILQKYFSELITTCILWNKKFDFNLLTSVNNNVFIHIDPSTLSTSFSNDINDVYYDDLIKMYVAAIEQSHCEGFLSFQDDIPIFAEAFQKASSYSIWRTTSTRFLFVYAKDKQKINYFQDNLFKNQANILIIEADFMNSSIFSLKTNKFVGSIFQHPEELVQLSSFNASNEIFSPLIDLFPKRKLQNLQGREIIVGGTNYRPRMAIDFKRLPQYYDHSKYNPTHMVHVDGTEIRVCHTFCEIFNCTVQFEILYSEEWDMDLTNFTVNSTIEMIKDGKFHIIVGAMLAWYPYYSLLDISNPVGRSGITCLVPVPSRILGWTLSFRPFQLTLWLAVFACILLESLALATVRRFEQYLEKKRNNSWLSSFKFGYIITLKLMVTQGVNYITNSHTVRTMLFACYMIDIILISIYGGGLAAILTVPTLEEAADSVERLYKHNIPWTSISPYWAEIIKKKNDNPIYKKLYENFKLLPSDDLIQKSKTENMAFAVERMVHGHFGNIDFIPSESLHRLKLMVDDMYWDYTVVLTPRLWAFLAKYNDFILAWRSSGLDIYWEWKIAADYLDINKQNLVRASRHKIIDTDPVELEMDNFTGLILPWIVGVAISILVFIGELAIFYIRK